MARRRLPGLRGETEALKFGLHPEEVARLLAEYGWREREQVGPDEYTARYLQPAGRQMRASEIERAVYAER
jgi:O-methyltransferase involved in polyketide biosynthesis